MHVITFATQKGGSGKSTLASCVAVAAEADGFRVAVLDTDPQRTTAKWGNRREAETPAVDFCEPHQLEAVLKGLEKQKFDLVVIDTAGAHNVSVAPALQLADFCVVPVKPNLADLESAVTTAKQLNERKTRFGFVLSQCFGSTARTNDAATGLLRHGEVATANIFHRADYADAHTAGMGVTEFNPNGRASQEILLLWAWLRRVIGEAR